MQPVDLTIDPPQLKGRQIKVGNAPNSIVLNGTMAYVSNEGGRPATPTDFTNVSNGTPIVANTTNGGAATGTVSVIDTEEVDGRGAQYQCRPAPHRHDNRQRQSSTSANTYSDSDFVVSDLATNTR